MFNGLSFLPSRRAFSKSHSTSLYGGSKPSSERTSCAACCIDRLELEAGCWSELSGAVEPVLCLGARVAGVSGRPFVSSIVAISTVCENSQGSVPLGLWHVASSFNHLAKLAAFCCNLPSICFSVSVDVEGCGDEGRSPSHGGWGVY